jgi:hypothetical protein
VIVAAGRFDMNGRTAPFPLFSFNNLSAQRLPQPGSTAPSPLYLLRFPAFTADGRYIVKGTPVNAMGLPAADFEVIPSTDPAFANTPNVLAGIVVRLTVNNELMRANGFMVEISQF